MTTRTGPGRTGETAGGVSPEPAPRPAYQTAGVPTPRTASTRARLAQTGRPLLWLAVVAGTIWPLTGRAIVAAVVVLLGAACAVVAARDPRIPSVTGDGERWRTVMLSLCALGGLIATLLVPQGAGWATALVGGALIGRLVIDPRLIWGFSIVAGIAAGVAFSHATGSPWSLLVGLAVPALASRSLDRARLHREHARVTALLVERDALREVELAAAAGEERARIARDLHDVLAHTLSGLSLHLQGIRAVAAKRLGPDDPVIGSVDKAADLARTGLAEAKEAVAALREDSPRPAPGAADLAALADEHGATLTVSGDPDALAPSIRETVFATVREALTNAGRHAPDAPVTITLDVGDAVEVRVANEGPGSEPGPARARGDVGGGRGLVGLRERAALVGATLDAGPDGDGWRVSLHVPVPVPAGHPAG
ncbi:histidine kinase [Actinomycetospora endophytica]|uniref:histidine kinase n=1 Tax=Actinomycetospora endophytica TaxID=2291215 RepID=A0ABS8PBF2_9PSEU|nr:histidine kinase [Actinomycetospora endophytica]MCD2194840.1 histidine kinase [Actinomycetospora endophytica]